MKMEVKIFWKGADAKTLLQKVKNTLEELGLSDFIKVETTQSEELQKELGIQKEPALIIEEESIDFKDTIFEWMIPSDEELKSMFISIVWWQSGGGCAPWGCGSWCSC